MIESYNYRERARARLRKMTSVPGPKKSCMRFGKSVYNFCQTELFAHLRERIEIGVCRRLSGGFGQRVAVQIIGLPELGIEQIPLGVWHERYGIAA